MSGAGFIADLKAVADADLGLDTANQDAAQIAALVRLTDKIPHLRAVIDHLPQMVPPAGPKARKQVEADLRELAARPQVFLKLSEVLRRIDGQVPVDLEYYRSRLDEIWEIFGVDRIMYGSDWPNSDRWGSYQQVFNLVHEYVTGKGVAAAEKFFWKNSIPAYRWVKRAANQPEIK
jgi:predicted TIM-barrel fold metal-dependent hydrolase